MVDNYLKIIKDSRMIVSNYGILGEILPNKQFSVIYPYWDETFPSYAHFCRKYGMAPVCLILNRKYENIFVFANANESRVFDSTIDKENELNNIAISLARWNWSATFKATFYLGALRHHLCSLIKAYLDTASEFSNFLTIPADWKLQDRDSLLPNSKLPIEWIQNLPVVKVGASMLGSSSVKAIFFEMMAYLTSARSLLDSLVPILVYRPSVYKSEKHPSKRYSALMKGIEKYKLPIQLKEFLTENWAWVSKLIDYRDCLLHYCPLSRTPLPSVMAIHTENRIIALLVWLPDNPETRSMKNFRFDTHIDYLGYAHATYLKLIDFCFSVLKDTYSEVGDT